MEKPLTVTEDIRSAYDFARAKHEGQLRKYTGEPYIVHPMAVCQLIVDHVEAPLKMKEPFKSSTGIDRALIIMKQTALLHDTVEDTDCTFDEIKGAFGQQVCDFVFWLADLVPKSKGNRAMRNELSTARLFAAPAAVRMIKMCDILDNISSIVENDPRFARFYIAEKRDQMQFALSKCSDMEKSSWVRGIYIDLYHKVTRRIGMAAGYLEI